MKPAAEFTRAATRLEAAYLVSHDPVFQSGFSGGRDRWVAERSPWVEAIHRDGDLLDVGCANGLLVDDVVTWSSARGYEITPHGVDIGPRLIDLAMDRLPEFAANFHVADAWEWEPGRQWTYVYSLLELSPQDLWRAWIERLRGWVEPSGRLVLGSYGSRSRHVEPADVAEILRDCGLVVSGEAAGGDPVVARFAWTEG